MERGRKIEMFLVSGGMDGLVVCGFPHWAGQAYRFPRFQFYDRLMEREDLVKGGKEVAAVYILLGQPEEGSSNPPVYIGETDEILKRLTRWYQGKEKKNDEEDDKEFWTETIVFFSKSGNLTKTHVKYLESRLLSKATEIGRCELKNIKASKEGNISEADREEMEEFIENMVLIVQALGHKIFTPLNPSSKKRSMETISSSPQIVATSDDDSVPEFIIKFGNGMLARCIQTAEGFLVLKGSQATLEEADHLQKQRHKSTPKKRVELKEDGTLIEQDGALVFTTDSLFSSPSAAASVILGRSANGKEEWKTEDGFTLKEYEANKFGSHGDSEDADDDKDADNGEDDANGESDSDGLDKPDGE